MVLLFTNLNMKKNFCQTFEMHCAVAVRARQCFGATRKRKYPCNVLLHCIFYFVSVRCKRRYCTPNTKMHCLSAFTAKVAEPPCCSPVSRYEMQRCTRFTRFSTTTSLLQSTCIGEYILSKPFAAKQLPCLNCIWPLSKISIRFSLILKRTTPENGEKSKRPKIPKLIKIDFICPKTAVPIHRTKTSLSS